MAQLIMQLIKITIATNKVPTLTKAKTDIRHNGQVKVKIVTRKEMKS